MWQAGRGVAGRQAGGWHSQLPLQHVHQQAVHTPCHHQVPHQAAKVPGGAQELVLRPFINVLVGELVYL